MNGLQVHGGIIAISRRLSALKRGVILLSSWMIVWNDWLGFWLYNIIKCVITWGRSSPQRFCSCSSWSHKFSVAQHSHIQYRPDLMGLPAAFWDHAPISLLVCLLPSLMSPLLPLWFPPHLRNLSSSLCLRTANPLAWMTIVQLPSHQQSWRFLRRLLKKHICTSIPATLDPLQFAYRPNRSTDDAISQVLHSSLTHIDSKNGNYVRLLFIDYSSAFNTIVPPS